jgi:plastocyanin
LIIMVVALGDLLALVLAAAIAAGLALTQFRGGLIGTVLLGLVFLPIGVYTFTGTLSKILYGESLQLFAIPALLAAFSLAGLVAAVAAVAAHEHLEAGGKTGILVVKAAIALFVVIMAAGLLTGRGELPATPPTQLAIETENMAYSTNELVSENGAINISLANHDLFWHTFTVDELDVDLSVPVGSEREAGFSAPPGTYTFYCAIPGHELLGMRGTLTVLEAAG